MISEAAIARKAEALENAARDHKRAMNYHRRRLRAKREELRRLQKMADRFGFELVIAERKKPHG